MFVRKGQALGSVLVKDRRGLGAGLADKPKAEKPETPDAPAPGTKAALIEQAEGLGLDTSGTKAELEARITEATSVAGPSESKEAADGHDDADG